MYTKLTKISLLFTSFLALFLFRYYTTKEEFQVGEKVEIIITITSEPLIVGKNQKITHGNLRIFLPRFPEVHYGDVVSFRGVVRQGRAGPYVAPEKFEIRQEAGILPKLKQRILSFYRKTLPEPEASLVAGITLGTKSGLPQDFFGSLKSSGTLHVVVASGMNVTLVAKFLISVLVLFVARGLAIPLAILSVWFYVFLVGLEAPIVRAGIMGSLAFVAQATGRLRVAWWTLGLASLAMLLFKPGWISDLGFLLSFGATAGILAFEGKIRERLLLLPVLREDLATTLAAQIVTTPLIFASFAQFSLWSPIANTLVLWTVAPIMVLGGLAGLFSFILEPFARFLLLLVYPLALFFVKIVSVFG